MVRYLSQIIDVLTSPTLPPKILAVTAAVATVIIVTGIGIWGIIGAWRAFKYLITVDN